MPRFHDARFDSTRFDSTPADSAWPPYLKQEHAQARFVRVAEQRRRVARVKHHQRNRQRPLTAWSETAIFVPPQQSQARMKVPWRIWTIRR